MPTFKVTVAYDGSDFVGWQRQAAGVSIQGVLEDALRALDGRKVAAIAAGRTDAGVHAVGQVVSFALDRAHAADTVVRALNARLPASVRVVDAAEVPASFHAQFDARSKTYRYRIWNGNVMSPFERRYAWHLPGALDVGAMRAAAALLEGEHDFAAFQGSGSDVATTVRRVVASRIADCRLRMAGAPFPSAVQNPQPALIEYEITGTGFLRHMVRAIVGSLVDVGCGRQPVEWMRSVLEARNRSAAGQTAPASGLFLMRVDYRESLASDA